ncbi:MAG: TlpA family protein disulfide reductase [Proteobacteria bacterium]|nr:TlpA family protein disulfide reductase [Pseudomonadota bacterium]
MAIASRRRLLFAGTAAAALTLGASVALWRLRLAEPVADAPWLHLPLTGLDGAASTLGERLTQGNRPLLVNFWATWCPPCLKEMPELDAFAAGHPAWQVLGVALDGEEAVRGFLARQPVRFGIALADPMAAMQAMRDLGNAPGGLPFTALLDARGAVRKRELGATSQEKLRSWAQP